MKSADRFVEAARKLNDWKRLQDEEAAARQRFLSAFETWKHVAKAVNAAHGEACKSAYEATCELAAELGGDMNVIHCDTELIAKIERVVTRVKHGLDG